MIECSGGYREAIVGDSRRIYLRAVIDIIDPDIRYGAVGSQSEAAFSLSAQLYDKLFTLTPYATLERNRWVLDGTFRAIPDDNGNIRGQMGYVSGDLSGEDGAFAVPQFVELSFSNVSILQACSVYFPTADYDGVPAEFTVEVRQGGTVYYSKAFTGSTESSVSLDGFTVYDPDAIRVTVTKWSMPGRRARIAEIVPGIYEEWDEHILASFQVTQQANFACLALPYGTCSLRMDNLDRRFEPRSKNGLFQSIEERQGMPVSIGVRLPEGGTEYKQVGVYYQYSGGWKTGDNGLSMQWDLVDIVGLLADREFLVPDVLPATLSGWIAALAAQLGPNFADRWHVDPDYGDLPLTVSAGADVTGKKCGDILRWACMAAGAWPRADAETGYLTAEPYWSQGNRLDLDNMTAYPTMKANDDLAAIIFKLYDGSDTQYIVSGNSTASSATVSVDNPFLHTAAQALTAARLILSTYGGNKLETSGRGDPSCELGDVDTVWLNESSATTGRRVQQTFGFSGGVLQGCQSTLLQADGSFLFQSRAILTEDQTWTAPAGVTKLRLIVVGGGSGGTSGTDGNWDNAGTDGRDGEGAMVWAGTVNINEQQSFAVQIGQGGGLGQEGGDTAFGVYSSADGKRFPTGYTDIANGDSFARSGVQAPLAGTGDGGAGGRGGNKGQGHYVTTYGKDGKPNGSRFVTDVPPGRGTPGIAGQSGCVVIYWDKEGA